MAARTPTPKRAPTTKAAKATAKTKSAGPAGRSGGTVDAPGKAHRKPPASAKGVKHSDLTISKIKDAQTMRRGDRRG